MTSSCCGDRAQRGTTPLPGWPRPKRGWLELDDAAIARIEHNLIAGLPATEVKYDRAGFLKALAAYDGISAADLAEHLTHFLRAVVPVAEERSGSISASTPTIRPFPLFGLPRVVSDAADVRRIFAAANTRTNGLTFCTGSFGTREDNDLTAMAREFAHAHPLHPPAQRHARGGRVLP